MCELYGQPTCSSPATCGPSAPCSFFAPKALMSVPVALKVSLSTVQEAPVCRINVTILFCKRNELGCLECRASSNLLLDVGDACQREKTYCSNDLRCKRNRTVRKWQPVAPPDYPRFRWTSLCTVRGAWWGLHPLTAGRTFHPQWAHHEERSRDSKRSSSRGKLRPSATAIWSDDAEGNEHDCCTAASCNESAGNRK